MNSETVNRDESQDGVRVLVIDDERHLRDLLQIALSDEGYAVRTAPDGPTGLALARDFKPEVIVLDVMLPKIDGIELLPMLRRITESPIIMLSAKGDASDKVLGLRHGADDYLAKPFDVDELLARLQSALRRPHLSTPSRVSYADLTIDLDTRDVLRSGKQIDLSAREFSLLLLLARNATRVFDRDRLIDLVWGSDRDVGPGVVDTYISYLRAKVDEGFPTKLIKTVRGAGYTLREH